MDFIEILNIPNVDYALLKFEYVDQFLLAKHFGFIKSRIQVIIRTCKFSAYKLKFMEIDCTELGFDFFHLDQMIDHGSRQK